jgi:DtxR family transcriptional regulator, Mn-dependent transcriptional regulator
MNRADLTSAMEDYLKEIYHLQEAGGAVGTAALATRLGVAAPSVTHMVKRLHDVGLVRHSPYQGIELTTVGRSLALEVIRHHRLIELYLAEFLGMPWDKVHDEAERLEHVISEDLESRIAEKLGQPGFDPHGDPIPTCEGTVPEAATSSLWDVPIGERVRIARVSDRDPGLLAFLSDISIVPGAIVTVRDRSPYAGTATLEAPEGVHVVGADLARTVRVWPVLVASEAVQ